MKKKIILILSLAVNSFAGITQCGNIFIKIKEPNVAVLLKKANNQYFVRAEKASPRYITHLQITREKDTLCDISTNDSLGTSQLFEFNILNTRQKDTVNVSTTFNTGEILKCSTSNSDIDNSSFNYHITHPDIWKATNFDDAIKLFYGTTTPIISDNNYYLSSNSTKFPTGNPVRLNISSSKNLESIMILVSGEKYVVQTIMKIPENNKLIDEHKNFLKSPILVFPWSAEVTIVYRTKSGKVYRQDIPTKNMIIETDTENGIPSYNIQLLGE
jgi:hypothetical protein